MVHLTPRIHKLMHPSSQMKLRAVPKSVHAQVICRIRLFWIPSTTKCLRSPWGQIPGFQNGDSVQFQTFDHPPFVDPRRFWFLELFFLCCNLPLPPTLDIFGSCEVATRKAQCPLFWALSKVPGILVIETFQEQDFYVYLWHSTGIHCTDMISLNSFCRIIFTRAIDMNLDPPFLYNPLNKNE